MSRGYSKSAYEPEYRQPKDLFGGFAESGAPPHREVHRPSFEVMLDGSIAYREEREDSLGRTPCERDDDNY